MAILLDTGILLRMVHRNDPLHSVARSGVRALIESGERMVATLQNFSEFWNVCTRPSTARGGLGLSVEQTEGRLRLLERTVYLLPEPAGLYDRWRQLVIAHRVLGVQVHDAKLVAAMLLHGVGTIMTFNGRDYARYTEIAAISPNQRGS